MTDDDRRRRGLEMMDAVYGAGFSETLPDEASPMLAETIDHLFGAIWARPGLSIRDRRLLVLGATAALGRADLVEIQVRGALANAELTAEQLREAVLHLHFYVGWGNGTQFHRGVEAALATTGTEPAK
ncbi:carboxymuconolactone decarboxylase family protein [Amycolatopsis sp. NBC_01307]|uniref:carboxymuconolactone decarboxylase family protein n=1 Tax=Amycolatopsis sp. NBC_01307 TaxID=2903561 RepID=UPI002E0E8619|nr:carboxymuconolactone decarboxylase family protein [Amycolatopsis sp. NBC_01307]